MARPSTVMSLWPQANGGVERCMPMLKKVIQSAHVEKNRKQELYKFLRNYRATSHSRTGVTPAEAMFGRKMKVKLPKAPTTPNSYSRHAHLDTHMRKHDFLMKKK